jgi:tousled-like kinase
MVERWEEGYEFQDLEDQISKLNKEKEDIEKKRKALTKQRATPDKRLQRTDSLTIDSSMVGEQEEIYKLRLATLKKEEAELAAKLHTLQAERDSHVREVRRIRDESASRFGNHPILSDRYLLLELLGRGGFSEVWKAFDLVEMQIVAVKIHSLHAAWSDDRKRSYTRHALREYQIHKQLLHPRIVRLFDVFEIDDSSFATVLEYCDGNDLETHLQLQPSKVLSEREARSIVQQCFSALKYLNQLPQPVIHYDLKPGNLLFSHGQVRLTDFGLSKIVETHTPQESLRPSHRPRDIELTSQGAGTYWYLPPECFHRDGPALISSKVDVWSMGVIFYEMLYGVKPFGANQSQQSILRGDTITNEAHMVTFPGKPVVSQETKDFIRKCLEYRKERRPDVLTICTEQYLNPR